MIGQYPGIVVAVQKGFSTEHFPDIEWFWLFFACLSSTLVSAGVIFMLARSAQRGEKDNFWGSAVLAAEPGNPGPHPVPCRCDFLDFYVGQWHWPVQVADIADWLLRRHALLVCSQHVSCEKVRPGGVSLFRLNGGRSRCCFARAAEFVGRLARLRCLKRRSRQRCCGWSRACLFPSSAAWPMCCFIGGVLAARSSSPAKGVSLLSNPSFQGNTTKKPYIFPCFWDRSFVLTGCANGVIDAMQMHLNQQEQDPPSE